MRHQEEGTARQRQNGAASRRDSARLLERRTTLAAIAAEAGVSLPTVSKVVNGRPDVAPATRARVEQLLDQHQYSRSGLRRHRRSGLIDVVFAGLDSPWAVEILRGIEEWGAAHETAVAVSSVRHGNARPASWTSALASHHTDGVILVTTRLTDAQLGQVRLADGRTMQACDWAALTQRALGFPLPVTGLASWIRGGARAGSAFQSEVDARGRATLVRQDGWEIVFDYADAASDTPARMRMTYPDVEVRIALNRPLPR